MMSRTAPWLSGWLSGLAIGATIACLPTPLFGCADDAHCRLDGVDGSCDAGYCAYPDEGCASGRRYHEHAGNGLAGVCVDVDGTTGAATEGSSSAGSDPSSSGPSPTGDETTTPETDGTDGPSAVCGNGTVEDGEDCDDANTEDDAECNRRCEDPGKVVWQLTPETPGRQVALAVLATGVAAPLVGSEVAGRSDLDVELAQYDATGAEVWRRRHDSGTGDDGIGDLVETDSGARYFVGHAGGLGWIAGFDDEGALGDEAIDAGVQSSGWSDAVGGEDGRLYVTGSGSTTKGDPDVRTQCYTTGLAGTCGLATYAGPAVGGGEGGRGLAWQGTTLLVVGEVNPGPGARADLFTQRLDAELVVLGTEVQRENPNTGWTDVAVDARGRAFSSGYYDLGSGRRQVRIGAFDVAGVPSNGLILDREIDATDFGRAVAVDSQGHVIIVGELDASPVPRTRDDQAFIAKYDASLTEIWTLLLPLEDARARAVAIDPMDNILVVGDHGATNASEANRFVVVLTP